MREEADDEFPKKCCCNHHLPFPLHVPFLERSSCRNSSHSYSWRIQTVSGNETSDWMTPYTFSVYGTDNVPGEFDRTNKMMVQHFPDPVSSECFINFYLDRPSKVKIELFNSLGELVSVVAQGDFYGGTHQVKLEKGSLPSGAYIYRITAGSLYNSQKLIIE